MHTTRPQSHWRGFLAPWSVIVVSLLRKLKGGRWLSLISRQRQQYWWHGFSLQAYRLYSGQDIAIALFRFGVTAELVGRKSWVRGEREKVIGELVGKEWEIPGVSNRRSS